MIGQRLGEVIAQIPAQAEPIGHDLHQLPLRAQPFEEQDQLQLEEDDRIDGGSSAVGIGLPHQLTHEAQVERPLQVAIEVIGGNQVIERQRRQSEPNARSLRPVIVGHSFRAGGSAAETASSHPGAGFSTGWGALGTGGTSGI